MTGNIMNQTSEVLTDAHKDLPLMYMNQINDTDYQFTFRHLSDLILEFSMCLNPRTPQGKFLHLIPFFCDMLFFYIDDQSQVLMIGPMEA